MLRVGWAVVGMWSCVASAAPSGSTALLDPAVSESSGLVASKQHPGVFWTHNDSPSGGKVCAEPASARSLFAVDGDGLLVGTVVVEGACNVDWEDLTLDDAGNLWIADMGNNDNDRDDLTLYRVAEPDPSDGAVAVDRVVRFTYPDQSAFPDPQRRHFDAEALFWADGTLWVLTKHRGDLATTLYRFPSLEGRVVLERVQDFTVGGDPAKYGGMVTAADLHPSGRYLAVLTYHAIFVFERPDDGRSWLSRPLHRVDFDQARTVQCEGLAWDGWSLLFTNEDRAIFRVADPFRRSRFPGSR